MRVKEKRRKKGKSMMRRMKKNTIVCRSKSGDLQNEQ
jgi:hypothetical protein